MILLFDSSAIINLIGLQRTDVFLDHSTIQLAYYEVGNAVWKQVHLKKSLPLPVGQRILQQSVIALNEMKIEPVRDWSSILDTACSEGLVFYDAAYLWAAKLGGYTLVSDDDKLARVAEKHVSVRRSEDLL